MRLLKLPVIASLGILASCSQMSCENEVLDTIPSPDGSVSAVVFNRNCGATTGGNIHVSVISNGALPTEKGNALVMDEVIYSWDARPKWEREGKLTLTIPPNAKVFHKSNRIDGIQLEFVNEPSQIGQ